MRVLVACEFSGVVRRAFRALGHDAWSCDLLPAEDGSDWHIQDNVIGHLRTMDWDLMIAHPPCTHLAVSGARWWPEKQKEQEEAIAFVCELMAAPIHRIAIENPIGKLSSAIRKPEQIIQPWQFGHGETKATCLWLKNLPALRPTDVVEGREARVHRMPPGPNRWKERAAAPMKASLKRWQASGVQNDLQILQALRANAIVRQAVSADPLVRKARERGGREMPGLRVRTRDG